MTETTLKTKKDESYYKELVLAFFKDPKYANTPESEKNKFMQLCIVNKLNPILNQAFAVPYGQKLQMTVSYKMFQERAEASGLLSGWNILRTRDKDRKIISGKITIYRKDWTHPFEEEVELADVEVKTNPLWKSNPYGMLKKQLIRMGFSACFPENCKSLEIVEPEIEVIDGEVKQEVVQEPVEVAAEVDGKVEPVSTDQEYLIESLMKYLPEGIDKPTPISYDGAEMFIRSLQFAIAKRYVKDKSIKLTHEEIENIFQGDDDDMIKTKKAALKQFNSTK